jgi:hypothetical protein
MESSVAEAVVDNRDAALARLDIIQREQRVQEVLAETQQAAQEAQASKEAAQAAAKMLEETAKDHAWRQGGSGAAGRRQEAAAEVRSQATAAAASGEEQLVEADRRRERHLHLRVKVMAGTAPAHSDGQATLKELLLDRLSMSEESVGQVMATVSLVRVYPNKKGPGFTLMAHLTCPYSKNMVIRRRNKWRSNGSSGPALSIGHDLTPAQRDAHAKLFPAMRGLYERGLSGLVEMIYYPAVCLRVCGELYSDAAVATRAGEAALRRGPQATNVSPRRASTGVGVGATQQAGPAPGGRPTQAAQAAAAQALRDLPAGQQEASPASPPPPPPPAVPGPPPAAPPPSPLPGAAGVELAAAGAAQEPAGLAPAGAAGAGQAAAGPAGPAGAN